MAAAEVALPQLSSEPAELATNAPAPAPVSLQAPSQAAPPPTIALRFLFANERARLDLEVAESLSVPELKSLLLAAWPADLERTTVPATASQVNLLAFGKFCADTSSLGRLPKFDWPTPIQVFVAAGPIGSSPARSTPAGGAESAAAGCCTVS